MHDVARQCLEHSSAVECKAATSVAECCARGKSAHRDCGRCFRHKGAANRQDDEYPMVMPPTTVSSAVVKEEDWAPTLSAVGSVSAVQGAVVSTELGGVVAKSNFQNGGVAKKGDVLIGSTARPRKRSCIPRKPIWNWRERILNENAIWPTRKVVSKQELDAAESTFGQKQGAVDNMRSMITKKEVRAPFDGQLGIRQVNVGQMINAGQQVVQLTALDPVYVDFALPQQELFRSLPPGTGGTRSYRRGTGPRVQRQS